MDFSMTFTSLASYEVTVYSLGYFEYDKKLW